MPVSEDRERRTHFRGKPRPGRRVDVEFKAAGSPAVKAHTRNVGVGGAFIITATIPSAGTGLDVTLALPAGPLTVRAEVRWAVPDGEYQGFGVKFLQLEVDQLLALNEFFASLTGDEES